MPIRRPLGSALVLLPIALGCAALGWWQIDRMNEKQSLMQQFDSGESMSLDRAIGERARFARIEVTGRFDTNRHVLLDNIVLQGRPGVHVFTPFQAFNGTTILVNRGWKPMAADRRSLPDIWTPTVPVGIRGILAPPPEHRQRLGSADKLTSSDWPQLVTYLDIERVADALDVPLPGWVVWLDPADANGFEGRDWSPAVTPPERHRAYAFQWFALAITALMIWVVLLLRANRQAGNGGPLA